MPYNKIHNKLPTEQIDVAATVAAEYVKVLLEKTREAVPATIPLVIATVILAYAAPTNVDRIAAYGIEYARAKSRRIIATAYGCTIAIYVRSLKSLRLPRNFSWYEYADELELFKTEVRTMDGITYSNKITASQLADFMGGVQGWGEKYSSCSDSEDEMSLRYKEIFRGDCTVRQSTIAYLREQLAAIMPIPGLPIRYLRRHFYSQIPPTIPNEK
jgi:cellulase/cellobiase CelA1